MIAETSVLCTLIAAYGPRELYYMEFCRRESFRSNTISVSLSNDQKNKNLVFHGYIT
jgi:hypothetical protein